MRWRETDRQIRERDTSLGSLLRCSVSRGETLGAEGREESSQKEM